MLGRWSPARGSADRAMGGVAIVVSRSRGGLPLHGLERTPSLAAIYHDAGQRAPVQSVPLGQRASSRAACSALALSWTMLRSAPIIASALGRWNTLRPKTIPRTPVAMAVA